MRDADFINFRIFHDAPVEDDFVADCQLGFLEVLEKEEKNTGVWVSSNLYFEVFYFFW